ncbi:MAG: hypothetical protein WBD22_14655 [Pyrinomonadaceae bacterium]
MATQITQSENPETGRTEFRIEGEMTLDDAVLIERLTADLPKNSVSFDVADLDIMDSDSAAILKRLADERGFSIEGMEIFLQNAVNEAERAVE